MLLRNYKNSYCRLRLISAADDTITSPHILTANMKNEIKT